MHAQDKKQIERANARNAVEEYVYEMKDKLESPYKEFITEQVLQGHCYSSQSHLLCVYTKENQKCEIHCCKCSELYKIALKTVQLEYVK